MEKISCREAKLKGLRYYFTGKPCKPMGHVCERYVCNETCKDCHDSQVRKRNKSDNRKAYSKKYKQINKHRNKTSEWKRQGIKEINKPYPEDNLCENVGCRKPELRKMKDGTFVDLCCDHDHKTGVFRGWLCSRCNTIAGKIDENISVIRGMLSYLEGFYK